jgi:hypothetical protein
LTLLTNPEMTVFVKIRGNLAKSPYPENININRLEQRRSRKEIIDHRDIKSREQCNRWIEQFLIVLTRSIKVVGSGKPFRLAYTFV